MRTILLMLLAVMQLINSRTHLSKEAKKCLKESLGKNRLRKAYESYKKEIKEGKKIKIKDFLLSKFKGEEQIINVCIQGDVNGPTVKSGTLKKKSQKTEERLKIRVQNLLKNKKIKKAILKELALEDKNNARKECVEMYAGKVCDRVIEELSSNKKISDL